MIGSWAGGGKCSLQVASKGPLRRPGRWEVFSLTFDFKAKARGERNQKRYTHFLAPVHSHGIRLAVLAEVRRLTRPDGPVVPSHHRRHARQIPMENALRYVGKDEEKVEEKKDHDKDSSDSIESKIQDEDLPLEEPAGTFSLFNAIRMLMKFVTAQFFKDVQVLGLKNIPKRGPVIFCGNHCN